MSYLGLGPPHVGPASAPRATSGVRAGDCAPGLSPPQWTCVPSLAGLASPRRTRRGHPCHLSLWAVVCVLISMETGAPHPERLCAAPQAGPQAPCPLESQSVTTGVCRPCPMVEAPPQGPRWELRAPRPWASGTGRGERLPTRGTRVSSGSRDSRCCSGVTPPGGLAPTWTPGAHTSLGVAGVGLGVLPSPRPPDPRRGGVGRLGGEGAGCVPLPAAGHGGAFSLEPAPPPGCCWTQAFWSVFAAGEAAPSSGSPHPLHPSWCPGFPHPRGDLATPAKGRRLCGLGGSPTALPGRRGLCLQATSLQPVSGRLGVTRPRPSRWAKPQKGDGDGAGAQAVGAQAGYGCRNSGRPCT